MLKARAEVLLASKKTKALTAGLLVAGMMATSLVSAASPAEASIFFNVNSTGDQADPNTADNLCDVDPGSVGSQCTLRAAIQQANASPGSDSIGFDIPDNGALRAISPQSQLPAITAPVSIDGYTQGSLTSDPSDDATPNTKDVGDDAVIKIELNGASAGSQSNGLTIKSPRVAS
jgi:CSLREA domain-containing protein